MVLVIFPECVIEIVEDFSVKLPMHIIARFSLSLSLFPFCFSFPVSFLLLFKFFSTFNYAFRELFLVYCFENFTIMFFLSHKKWQSFILIN